VTYPIRAAASRPDERRLTGPLSWAHSASPSRSDARRGSINDRQLRYFAKVVEVGNMTKAAALLHVAQPALGLQIRQLEDSLGVPLLTRHSRGVEPTPAGRRLYERATEILATIEETEREIRAFATSRRETLTFGVTHSIMRLIGSELLVAARRDIPDLLMSLIEEPSIVLIQGIEASEVDLALTYEVTDNQAILRKPLLTEELLFVTHPDTAPAGETVSLGEALESELVLAHSRDPIRRMVELEGERRGLAVRVGYEVRSLIATRQVVLEGLAASILPYGTVAAELRDGRLVSRRILDAPFKRTLYLARPAGRPEFLHEDAIARLIRSVVKQLALDLGALAAPPDAG